MVTFLGKDTGLSFKPTWVMAWEDLPLGSSDKDYNDMVVGVTVVPEPTIILAGALLLVPFGATAFSRVRRNSRT